MFGHTRSLSYLFVDDKIILQLGFLMKLVLVAGNQEKKQTYSKLKRFEL